MKTCIPQSASHISHRVSNALAQQSSPRSRRLSELHPNSRSWLTPGRYGGILGRPFAVYLATLLCITLSISVASTASAQNVTVSGSTGADGTYATLQAAFTALNANTTQTGNTIQVFINASTTETTTAQLNNPTGGNWASLTITPTTAVSVSGNITAPLIYLNGVSNVTIDGINSGPNQLSIVNTNAGPTTSTIQFVNDASNNTVKNCTIAGAESATASGTIFFGTGSATGNQNNTIQNNTITNATGSNPVNAIYSAGLSATIFNSGTITGNNIQDYFSASFPTAGINLTTTGNSAWTITNNKLFQTATRVYTSPNTHRGIFVSIGAGYTITGNVIGFADGNGNGTTNIVGNSVALTGTFPTSYTTTGTPNATIYRAIECAFTAGGAVSSIQNNTIAGIALFTSSGATASPGVLGGIYVSSGNVNIGTTTGNTIGATSGGGGASASSLYASNTVAGGTVVGIYTTSANTVSIQNNTVGSVDSVGTTATLNGAFTGIDTAGAGTFTVNNNTVGNTDADNIRVGYTLTAGNLSNSGTLTSTTGATGTLLGVRSAATGATVNMSSNTLRGWANGSAGGLATTGITNTGAVTNTITMNSNVLGTATRGFVRYAFANSGTLTGILDSGAGAAAALNINSNDIRGITYAALSTGANTYINCSAVPLNFTANLNTFTNLNVNTSGTVTFILMTYTQSTATGTKTVNNNSIVTAFNRGGASGSVLLLSDNGSSVTGVVTTVQNNNCSNMTVAGTSTITGINLTDGGTAPTKNITGNTLNNWTAVTGAINAVNVTYWNGSSSLSNNTITNLTGQSTVTGITMGSTVNTANPLNVSSNTINNLSSTGTGGAVTGITCSNTSPVINISGNTITTLSSTGAAAVQGIVVSAAGTTGTTVSKNKICDLSGTNTATTLNGIVVSAATTSGPVTLANNLIGNMLAAAATGSNAIIGINITGSATTSARNVYYNTVYLNNPTSGAGFGSSGISVLASATSTTSTLDLRNNIVVNTSVQNGAGLTVAYRRSLGTAGTLANYASTSNNNDFYAGTPGASNLIYSDGTSTAQTISAYKNGVFTAGTIAPRDSFSFTENPPFLSTTCANATFLHINTGTPTQLESGGTPVTGFTTDFDGDTRNGSTPDVGADEFAGIAADFTPPAISYTALQRDLVAASRSFTNVTVTDASGVNTTTGTRPRVYYKKSTNANAFNDNTNATDGWKYAEANGGGGSPFSFNIDYSLLFGGGGVSVGDNIQYFVVAQDLATTPNVGINSGTFAATPSSVALTAAAFPVGGSINSYNIAAPITGTFNVGTGGDYGTLTAAAADLNSKIITGPIVLILTDSSYSNSPLNPDATGEVFPIVINPNPGSSATNTITIKPATGVTAAVNAPATASAVLILNGASYVTIDGSNSGGTDRSLTFNNPNSTTNGVGTLMVLSRGVGAGATFDTIKNCIIRAGSIGTTSIFTFGIFVGDTSGAAAGADNDSLTLQNNVISLCRTGIQAVGTAAGIDDNMVISGNTIGDNVLANSIGRNGLVLSTLNNATISGNTIKNIFIASDTVNPIGISAGTLTNCSISQNMVTGITATSILPAGIAVSTASSNNTITQNTVDGVTTTSSTDPIGISIGTGFVNSTISRNIIQNITTTTTGGYGGRGFFINTGSATSNLTFSNNFISNIKGDGWNAFSSDSIAGVLITGTTGGLNFYYNSINLGSGAFAGNSSGTLSAAFYVASTVTNLDIRDNIFVTNLVNTTASTAKTYAIYSDAASSAFTNINNNDYFVSGTQGVLGFIGATDRTTLAAIQAGFGQNGNSVNGNPQFTSATDLHINPSIGTVVEGTATPIVGIAIDIDGDTRNATTPDIGADEGNFTAVVNNDMQATAFVDPVNGGSKLANTAFSPQASFTNNGLNTQTGVTVRYRICADGACNTELYNNTQVIASITSGATTTVTFASVAGGLSAGTYTIKAKSELGGDQVPTNDEITGTFTVQSPLSGNYTVGTGGNYQTITAAVNSLNNLGVSGPVTLTLTDSSYMRPDQPSAESYPITINAIPGASATNTVTVKPAAAGTTITGSSTTALFILNSTSYVTIDGSSNGTSSRDLTVTNNNASAAAVIWLKSNGTGLGATNNTIKNVNIVGGSVTTTYGIALSGTTIGTAGADNDNNALQNNSITSVNYGIYANGTAATSAGGLDGLSITNNVIGPAASGATNTGFAGIYLGNAVSPVVTGNTIRNLTTSSGSTGGIYLVSNVTGAGVSQNTLTNLSSSASASGTAGFSGIYLGTSVTNTLVAMNKITTVVNTSTSGYTARGIMLNTSNASSNDMIVDNFITDVYCFQDSSNIYWPIGIAIETSTGGVKVYFNSVNLFGQHTGYASNTTGGGAPALFINTSVTGLDVQDNVFTSSYENTTSTGDKSYGIFCASANTAFTTINYNDYYATSPTSGSTPILGSLNGTDYTTIASWRTATGQDAQSISANPGYVSNTDLHLATSPIPPVSRAGLTILGITTDIDGDTRQSPPDMGADEITTYMLTYTAGANGSITGTTPQEVISGGTGTAVTAVANACYHFVNWSDGSTQNPRTDSNVFADLSVTANFAINTYTLTYTAGPNGTVTGTTPQTINCGSNGTAVTAVPDACYHFVNWSDGSTDNPRTDTNVMMNINVTANFAINTYTLTYTAGPNGTVTGTTPQTVNCGSNGTAVTAVPDACYHFVNWSDGSTDNPRTDTNVMMDISVTANFAINTYTLTYTAGTHGSISGTTPQMVNCGGSGSAVTAVPDSGYVFVNWSDASTQNPRTDTNVMMDISVTANFASTNANLANLVLSQGTLQPAFDPNILNYTADERHRTTSITVTPTVQDANATVTVNGQPVPSGQQSQPISLNVGNNTITIVVYAQDEGGHPNAPLTTKTYTIIANRADVPVVTNTNDSGAGSLRDALDDVFDGETITFNIAAGRPNVAQVITLTSGELVVNNSVTIAGPGANMLTVMRDPNASAFRIYHIVPGKTVTISGMTISGGVANVGGGIYSGQSTLTVNGCALADNMANDGGGIYNDTGTVAITNSTLDGNSASSRGGAIFNSGLAGTATVNMNNSTLSGNSAPAGGGLFSSSFDLSTGANVANSTLSGNSSTVSPAGDNLYFEHGTLTIGNTILKKGASGVSILSNGTVVSAGYNLSDDNGAGFLTAAGDQVNTDPMLGPLKDNGGTTLTHAPLIGSPAIDQGKRDTIPTLATNVDQRGFARPIDDPAVANAVGGDASDIGAVELVVGVHPTSAVSRKTHTGIGDFDVDLPMLNFANSPLGIECRTGGAAGVYKLIFFFSEPVSFSSAAVTSGAGSVDSTSGLGTSQVTINLIGVADVQTITVGLFDVDNGTNSGDVGTRMGMLIGDVNANRSVNAADVSLVKSNSGSGVSQANFRSDVNANGAISAADVSLVKSKSGNGLP